MICRCLQLLVFIVASMIQVTIVEAKDYVIPAEEPKNCLAEKSFPCSLTTGDSPRMFRQGKDLWELDRDIVLETNSSNKWRVYSGLLVLDSHQPQKLHTPFADIFVGQSKVMIHVLKDKVRVMALNGEGIKVKAKGDSDEHFLVPGFQNWYGGVVDGAAESGVASVIDFKDYARHRSGFFMNHELGFVNELAQVAKAVKWAAQQAANMHRDLVERKMASLEVQHQKVVTKKRRKINFNKYLRRLFLQKIRYDY